MDKDIAKVSGGRFEMVSFRYKSEGSRVYINMPSLPGCKDCPKSTEVHMATAEVLTENMVKLSECLGVVFGDLKSRCTIFGELAELLKIAI